MVASLQAAGLVRPALAEAVEQTRRQLVQSVREGQPPAVAAEEARAAHLFLPSEAEAPELTSRQMPFLPWPTTESQSQITSENPMK